MSTLTRWTARFLGLWLLCGSIAVAGELDCLTEAERAEANLYRRLQADVVEAAARRLKVVDGLRSAEDVDAYRRRGREFFVKQLGGFPKRTPLNARTVGVIEADGYRIEKVIFESQPQHHVTANLYLPDGDGPFPGVVVASGHSRTAKTADYNQRFGIAMATHGMAALCYDPIGQGERSQILDDAGQPKFRGTTTEHFLIGVGSILVGRNTARYRIWDGMRAIDYLQSRPEIDPRRIGMTGCSGGGTLTSYVMALDDRVACAAPACYLTTFERLIASIGPQDAEQNIFGQIAFGLDHPDYVLLRAPRPTLIAATTEDFFDIRGTWETFRQAKRIYTRLGLAERVDLVEADGKHGVKPESLATITHWMQRWLVGRDEPVPVRDIPVRDAAELLCTDSGQVLRLPGEKSVFDLNAEYAAELAKRRAAADSETSPKVLLHRVRELAGIRPLSELPPPSWEDRGRVARDGYHIDRLVLKRGNEPPIPALTFHPPEPDEAAYVYLHDAGKLGDTQRGGPVEGLVESGYAVVTVDLSGQGETAHGKRDPLLGDWKTYYLSYLLGRPLLGPRVEDALAAADFTAFYQRKRDNPRPVHLIGVGQAGVVALHAAALRPELFASVTLQDAPTDWTSVVSRSEPAGQLDSAVPAALTVYDLPDLLRRVRKAIGKQHVHIEQTDGKR